MPTVAVRVVRSRRKFINAPQIRAVLEAALDTEVKPYFIDQFKAIVKDWRHQPDFKARKFINPDEIRVNVFPAGEHKQIWEWVSQGTRGPYPIPSAGPRFLRFQTNYQPRTQPGSLSASGPGRATGPMVQGKMQVEHPGIEGREFERQILDDTVNQKWFAKTMENAFKRGIRAL